MALDYGSVKDMYDTLYDSGVTTQSLPEWSQDMNELTGTELYTAGLHDNWIKRASHGIDKLLEKTGLPGYGEELGRQVGGWVGAPEAGAEVGRGLPRATLNFAPLLIPGGGGIGAVAKYGLTGALTGAEAYEKTDSPLSALIAAGTATALPGIASKTSAAIGRVLSESIGVPSVTGPIADLEGNIVRQVSEYFPQTAAQRLIPKIGGEVAGQVAGAGAVGVSQPLEQLARGEDPTSPFTVENLLGLTLGQAPFAAIHLARQPFIAKPPVLKAEELQKTIDLSQARIALKEAGKNLEDQTGVEQIPTVAQPPPEEIPLKTTQETNLALSRVRGEQITVKGNPLLTEEQKVHELNILAQQDYDATRQRVTEAGSTLFGDDITPEVPRQEVFGNQLYVNKTGTFRRIQVANDPLNPEELRGKVIGYSTKNEPTPYVERGTGVNRYSLPPKQWHTVNTREEWEARSPRNVPVGAETPELPIQPVVKSPEEVSAMLHELEGIHGEVDTADTTADLQRTTVKLGAVEADNDFNPTNDASLRSRTQQLEESGIDLNVAAKSAVKAQATRVARQVKAKAKSEAEELTETEQEVTQREQERAVMSLTQRQAGQVTAMMGEGEPEVQRGFSVITADHLTHVASEPTIDAQPIKDVVTDTAVEAAASPKAKAAFDAWPGREDTTYHKDFADFLDLTQQYGSLSRVPPEEAGKYLAERTGVIPMDAGEVQEFLNRPHVQEWGRELDTRLANQQAQNEGPVSAPIPDRIVRPAGNRFLFSMAPYDPVTNRLGGKHTLPSTGEIEEGTFQKISGVGKPLNKTELELYKTIVPEAFATPGKVNVRVLDEGLKRSGPVVETKTLGAPKFTAEGNESFQIAHRLDTELGPGWEGLPLDSLDSTPIPQEQRESIRRWHELEGQRFEEAGSAQYQFIGPKSPEQMPGYVEGLVRLPTTKGLVSGLPGTPLEAKYTGPHFGGEDVNVLSFYRGYEEWTIADPVTGKTIGTLPTTPGAEKTFHVIEVQSDWGQRVRTEKAEDVRYGEPIGTVGGGPVRKTPGHPLLDVYNELALKAAAQHAKDIGATKLIVSDAETAMMTEGHDRTSAIPDIPYNEKLADLWVNERKIDRSLADDARRNGKFNFEITPEEWPGYVRDIKSVGMEVPTGIPQARGMYLNYDQKLPSAMEKLTGQKGEVVDLGPHKNATRGGQGLGGDIPQGGTQEDAIAQMAARDRELVGSPVFKTPEGTPKTNVTGRAYDISGVPGELTLTEPARAPGTAGRADAPVWLPQEQRDIDAIDRVGLARGGQGMLEFLLASKNPIFPALAKDLSKFADSLARVSGTVRSMDGGAFLKRLVGRNYEVSLSPALLRGDDFTLEYAVAHELVHGLTLSELDNPTNVHINNEMTALRQRVIDQLPKDMRSALGNAVAGDWYGKWSNRQVTLESLMPDGTAQQRDTLYSLLSNQEFTAQGLSSDNFRNYLRGIKTKGQTWYNQFTNLVRTLLGLGDKVSGTVFEEFLAKTDALLDRGNYVSSFRNFSDRYFENLGMSHQYVSSNTQRAMGLILSDHFTESPTSALTLLRMGSGGVRSPEWMKAQRDAINMFKERGEDAMNTQSVLDETGHAPGHSGLLDLADSLMLGEEGVDALDVLPEAAARYVLETARDAQNILGAINAATREGNKGILNIAQPEFIKGTAQETLAGVNKVMEASRLHDMQVKDIQGMFSVTPDGFLDKVANAPEALPLEFSGEKEEIKRDMVSRFLEPTAQIARRIPESAEPLSRGFQLKSNVRHMGRESLKALGMDLETMRLTPKTVKDMFRTFSNTNVRNAADQWIAENNIRAGREGKGVTVIDVDDPQIQKIVGKLSPADRDIVEDMINKHSISIQHMQDQVLEVGKKISSTKGGALVQKLTGGKFKDSQELASRLLNAFTVDRTDPNAAAMADNEISFVQERMLPDQFATVVKFTEEAANHWKDQKAQFDQNKGWSTARRFGKYLIEFKKNGEVLKRGVDNKKEANVVAEGRPYSIKPNRQYDEDRPPSLGFDAPGVANRLRQYDQNMRDILQNTGTFSPEQIELMKKYAPGEQFITEEAYRGGLPNLQPQPRKLGKGAEGLPWLRNHVSWIHQTSNYWSRQLLRAQAQAHLMDPEIASNPQLKADLQTHFENMLQPDTPTGRFMQRFTTTWMMGANMASTMMNATQAFVTHVAEFTSMTGKPLNSYRRVLGALKEVVASGFGHKEWKDPVTAEFVKRFIKDGEADQSMYDDEAASNELLHTNLVRMLNGDKPQTLGQKLGTMAGTFSNAAMLPFRTVERINSLIAGIAANKYYLESQPTLGLDGAYAKAVQFHHAVNFGGGAAARPIGAFGGRGAFPRTTAMLATAMQSYNLGTAFQIVRYIRQGFFRPAGLTPAEVHASRAAAVQMLSTQLAAAGVLGLPFVSGMLSVLNQAFPDLELNRKLRENMNAFFGGDEDNGSVLNDIAMTGVPSMMGWDLQSRLSMGNTVPGVSEINGFQPEQLLGAPGNLVSSFVNGGFKLAAGEVRGVDAFMPSALKKIEQLLRSGGQVLDYRDRPIFTPTLGEKVGIALGFNPKRLSDFNAASRIAKLADDNIKRREGEFHQQMAGEVLKGNFGSVRQALQQRTRENKGYDPQAAVHAIAGAAEGLTFPRDLRREGTVRGGDVRARLLSSFNIPPSQPSEVDRLNFRTQVGQRLGLPATSPTGLQTATVMDELRRQNPEASRAELRQQATLLLHGRRQRTLALPTE